MSHSIHILRSAQKQLAAINPPDQERLIASIRRLRDDPRPPGSKKLTGRPAWRIRAGHYRVIYEIQDDRLVILIIAIAHRKDAYR